MKKYIYFNVLAVFLSLVASNSLIAKELDDSRAHHKEFSCREALDCILSKIDKKSPCCTSTPIDCLPFVIKKSGKYCVPRDLVYANNDTGHNAIVVQADNVDIDLCSHSISIKPNTLNPGVGVFPNIIFMDGHSNVTIHDGELRGSKPVTNFIETDWTAIRVNGGRNIQADKVNFKDLRHGIVGTCCDYNSIISANECTFLDLYSRLPIAAEGVEQEFVGVAIGASRVNGLQVTKCTFEQTRGSNPFGNGILSVSMGFAGEEPISPQFPDAPNAKQAGLINDTILRDCNFIRTDAAFLYNPAGDTHGTLLIENCNFLTALDALYDRALQICCGLPLCICRSEIIRNCTFKYDNLETLPSGELKVLPYEFPLNFPKTHIFIPSGHGLLIENCAFSTPCNGVSIVAGEPEKDNFYDNLVIRGCIFQGQARSHIFALDGKALLIQNCQFSDASFGVSIGAPVGFPGFTPDFPAEVVVDHCTFANICGTAVDVISTGTIPTGTVVRDSLFKRCIIPVSVPQDNLTLLESNIFHLNEFPYLANFPSGNFAVDNIETTTEAQKCETCTIVK